MDETTTITRAAKSQPIADTSWPSSRDERTNILSARTVQLDDVKRAVQKATAATSPVTPVALKRTLSKRIYETLEEVVETARETKPVPLGPVLSAIARLGSSGDARALGLLTQLAAHPSLDIREAVASALGRLGIPQCADPLLSLLVDDHSDVRHIARQALQHIHDPRIIRPLMISALAEPKSRYRVIEAVRTQGRRGLSELLTLIQSRDVALGVLALEAVSSMNEFSTAAAAALTNALTHENASMRAEAARAIGALGIRRAVPSLVRALKDVAPVRLNAVKALAVLGEPHSVPALVRCLSSTDRRIRCHAITGLGRCGNRAVVPHIVKIMLKRGRHDSVLLEAAVQALGDLGDARALPALLQVLTHANAANQTAIRVAIATALGQLKHGRADAALDRLLNDSAAVVRKTAIEAMSDRVNDKRRDRLRDLLKQDTDVNVRAAAAKALGKDGRASSIPFLEAALRDGVPIRIQAVIALGEIQDASCLPAIMAMRTDSVATVRYHAAVAIGRIGTAKHAKALSSLARDEDPMVCQGARQALEELGGKANWWMLLTRLDHALRSVAAMLIPAWVAGTVPSFDPRKAVAVASVGLCILLMTFWGVSCADGPVVRGAIQSIAFSPDGATIAVNRRNGVVETWNTATLDHIGDHFIPATNDIAFVGDSRWLALISNEALRLWDLNDDQLAPQYDPSVLNPAPPASGTQMSLASDSGTALIATDRETVVAWDVLKAAAVQTFDLDVWRRSFTVSPSGQRIAYVASKEKLAVTNLAAESDKPSFRLNQPKPFSLAFTRDGNRLAVSSAANIQVWNVGSNALSDQEPIVLTQRGVEQLAFHPNGHLIAARSADRVLLWDVTARESRPLQGIDVEDKTIVDLAFSPSGNRLAIALRYKVWLCDTTTGESVGQLYLPVAD